MKEGDIAMEDFTEALEKIGDLIAMIVGNIAEFFLGPLPKFLLRMGIPYLCILSVCLIASVIFRFTGFIVMISPISILIAMSIIGLLLLISVLSRKGGTTDDTDE